MVFLLKIMPSPEVWRVMLANMDHVCVNLKKINKIHDQFLSQNASGKTLTGLPWLEACKQHEENLTEAEVALVLF